MNCIYKKILEPFGTKMNQ